MDDISSEVAFAISAASVPGAAAKEPLSPALPRSITRHAQLCASPASLDHDPVQSLPPPLGLSLSKATRNRMAG